MLAARLRESVILDAADEAIYKASRRASRNLSPLSNSPGAPSLSNSVASVSSSRRESFNMVHEMYETFRWMDEDADLDLRLGLDDYHANLDGVRPPAKNSIVKPTFRRRVSITKAPFGFNPESPKQRRSPSPPPRSPLRPLQPSQSRRRSRTLSIIGPRHTHTHSDSLASIDPNATHYQDPEARLKLRVYLASPQKFDEAIEFGFPSINAVASNPETDKENRPSWRESSREFPPATRNAYIADQRVTYLSDSTMSLYSGERSPRSPLSPASPTSPDPYRLPSIRSQSQDLAPGPARHSPTSSLENAGGKGRSSKASSGEQSHLTRSTPQSGPRNSMSPSHNPQASDASSYTHAAAGSREMTLRMTLTRPDLRADEAILYGWQQGTPTRLVGAGKSPLGGGKVGRGSDEGLLGSEKGEGKEEDGGVVVRGPFGGVDGWGELEREEGLVKRFWKRVVTRG